MEYHNSNEKPTRHQQALDSATALMEEIRLLTRALPEEEDMVMVPMMRDAVMVLHKSVMMLAHGDLGEEDFYRYTVDANGKAAVLRLYLDMCLDHGYIVQDAHARYNHSIDTIESHITIPKKPELTVVK